MGRPLPACAGVARVCVFSLGIDLDKGLRLRRGQAGAHFQRFVAKRVHARPCQIRMAGVFAATRSLGHASRPSLESGAGAFAGEALSFSSVKNRRILSAAYPQCALRDLLLSQKHHRDMHKAIANQTTDAAPIAKDASAYQERLLRINVVQQLTGIGRSTIYSRMAGGDFPLGVRVHGNCIAWKESEINAWIDSRPRAGASASKGAK